MSTITAIGGPRSGKSTPFQLLRDAVAADMRQSTPETRAEVVAARAAYLTEQHDIESRLRFELAVSQRMSVLTAPLVEPPPGDQGSRWLPWAGLASFVVCLAYLVSQVLR